MMSKKIVTRQELAEQELKLAQSLTPKQKSQVRKKVRRELGPSYFAEKMSGLAAAARKIAQEEQSFLNFDPKGRPVN